MSRFSDHTRTHHPRQSASGRVIGPSQNPVPANTQHSQETDIHVRDRTRNPSKRAAANLRLKPLGHQDLLSYCIGLLYPHIPSSVSKAVSCLQEQRKNL